MDAQWAPLCEVTAYRILRNGFSIDINALTRVQFGAELDTGVVLIVSAGSRFVRDVEHTTPGIIDGLKDMAKDGLDGRMIIYGLTFQFERSGA